MSKESEDIQTVKGRSITTRLRSRSLPEDLVSVNIRREEYEEKFRHE